jgi:hypothetical protein
MTATGIKGEMPAVVIIGTEIKIFKTGTEVKRETSGSHGCKATLDASWQTASQARPRAVDVGPQPERRTWPHFTRPKAGCLRPRTCFRSFPTLDTCQLSRGHHRRQSPDCHRNWLYNKQHRSNIDIRPRGLEIFIFRSAQSSHKPSVGGLSSNK